MKLTRLQARRLAIHCQGLDGRWKLPAGKEGVARAVERLGYVQIDTIAVVQRAHHHTIWSRRGDYHGEMLHELQARDRRVFEYWAPAASYLPMRDFRYYVRRLPGYLERHTSGFLAEHRPLVRHVLARIRAEGPLGSADFRAPEGRRRGSWWDWKPAKQALEALFNVGELMVAERRHFQRLYDLTDRVLPPDVDTTPPDRLERARHVLRRRLAAQGLTRPGHRTLRDRRAVDAALEEMTASGEVTPVEVRGLEGEPYYALTEVLEQAAGRRPPRGKPLHILSPFDSLVINRWRLRALFDFDCKLECYLPATKRRWGYFCLPILWGAEFVGRADCKAERKARKLVVRTLMFEPGFQDHGAVLRPLAAKLRDFAAFNECERVVVEQAAPARARAPLNRELKRTD